jgi:hypothetical protein
MTMTPVKLRQACDKVGGFYAMARLFGKRHPPPYLYRRINRKVAMTAGAADRGALGNAAASENLGFWTV